jgi:cell division protein FtsW
MVYSSSAYVAMVSGNGAGSGFYFMEALKRVGLGLVFLVIASLVDYQLWGRLAKPGVLLGLALLVAVLLFGREVQGSKRWLLSASLQPSELMKILLIFYFAHAIQRKEKEITNFQKGVLPLLVVLGFSCGLVALEPNLGTTTVLAVIGFSLLYLGEAKLSHLLLTALVALVLFGLAALTLPHARHRLLSFWTAVDNGGTASVQVRQSLISLGSGGWMGVGLGHSRQKFLFLPTPHTDFIFSILGEELGLLGTRVR